MAPSISDDPKSIRCKTLLTLLIAMAIGGLPYDGGFVPAAEPAKESEPLPSGALCRLGTDLFRLSGSPMDIAYSPDGTLIALPEANTFKPSVLLMDAKTGTKAGLLVADKTNGRRGEYLRCVAFAQHGVNLIGGDGNGFLFVWKLSTKELVLRRKEHVGSIEAVAVSSDGKLLATASADGEAHILKANDFSRVQCVTSNAAKDIKEAPDGSLKKDPNIAEGVVGASCVAFTPDHAKLVVGYGSTGRAAVWNLKNGKLLRSIDTVDRNPRYTLNGYELKSLWVLADGRTLVTAGQIKVPREQTTVFFTSLIANLTRIRLWNLDTGEHLRDLSEPNDHGFGSAAMSPDQQYVAAGEFSKLRLRRVRDGSVVHEFPLPGLWGNPADFSPDGRRIVMFLNRAVGVFDIEKGKLLNDCPDRPKGMLWSIAWSSDDKNLVTGHLDGYVRVWDAARGEMLWSALLAPLISPSGHTSNVNFVAFTPDGRRVVAAGTRDDPIDFSLGIVAIYDATTGELLHEQIVKRRVECGAVSPDGRSIAVGNEMGAAGETHVYGFDVETGTPRFVYPAIGRDAGPARPAAIHFSADSTTAFVATGDCKILRLASMGGKPLGEASIDYRTQEEKEKNSPRAPWIWSGAYSRDGETFAACASKSIFAWKTLSGEKKLTIPRDRFCSILAVSPDGLTLVGLETDSTGYKNSSVLLLFDMQTGKEIGRLDSGEHMTKAAFSHDGKRLATGFATGSVLIWDVAAIKAAR